MAKKPYETEGQFVLDHVKTQSEKDGKKIFQVNQEPYLKFMKGKGLSSATLDQVHEAHQDYINGTIAGCCSLMEEHSDSQQITIRTRTPNGRIDTAIKKSVTTPNPSTGDKITKHGVVSVRHNLKKVMNKELLAHCEKAITALV